jgi:hypothetical protein
LMPHAITVELVLPELHYEVSPQTLFCVNANEQLVSRQSSNPSLEIKRSGLNELNH